LLREMRSDPSLADLPVVLLSARAGEEATVEGLDAGADDYLTKPFSARELTARISANLERARGRRQVRESEERFRTLVTATSDVIYRMSADWKEMRALDGRGILVDTKSPTQAWVEEYILAEDGPEVQATIQAAIESKSAFQMEHRVRQADGSIGWVFSRAIPRLSPQGEILEWFGAASDVSERVAAVQALRKANETLEQRVADALAERRLMAELIQTTDMFVQVLDRDFRVLAINEANASEYEAAFGFRPKVGESIADLLEDKPDLSEPVLAVWSRALAGEAFTATEQFGDPNLKRRYYEIKFSPLRSATGEVIGAYQFSTDVTERREEQERLARTEEALRQAQKMEAVGQLTGGLAHDFNNLLAGISGSLELMQSRVQQGRFSDVDRYMAAAQGAVKRAAGLTHRLLAFSRRQTLAPRPTDVNRLVSDMQELIQRSVGPSISIEFVGASGAWPTLVDPSQLENALLNLCINARDAMPDGGRIVVETANKWLDARAAREHDMPEGQYLALCVTDTGVGMTSDVISRAFEPFFTTKPLGEGTGLGLSMIYGFAQQSGGQVRIYSEVGKGTTVCVYLPRHYGKVLADDEEKVEALPRSEQGETVLVVDDEPTVRMLITDILEDLGYRALEAGDSASGLKTLQSDVRIDLLITDVGLPGGMNGRQMADAGRVVRPDLKVLFITGYAENAILSAGRLGPDMAVLTKPFPIETMAARIRSMIEAKKET
jgi:signal transduction histidine kinase/ActR/RegA family two-component response regulator